jgi:uncharacterized repeat protein (TIGR03803 family)
MGVFTNLYSFAGGNDGSGPHAGLTLSGNTLYGTTSVGGTAGNGTLFAINTDGSGYTSLYSFSGGNDGSDPQADLIVSGNTLYSSSTVRTLPEDKCSRNAGFFMHVNRPTSKCSGKF